MAPSVDVPAPSIDVPAPSVDVPAPKSSGKGGGLFGGFFKKGPTKARVQVFFILYAVGPEREGGASHSGGEKCLWLKNWRQLYRTGTAQGVRTSL